MVVFVVKKDFATKVGTITSKASSFVRHSKLEDFLDFLQAYTDIFTKNIHSTKRLYI